MDRKEFEELCLDVLVEYLPKGAATKTTKKEIATIIARELEDRGVLDGDSEESPVGVPDDVANLFDSYSSDD